MGTIQSGGKGPAVAEREVRSPRRDRRPTAEESLLRQNAIKASTTMTAAKWRSCGWRLGSERLFVGPNTGLCVRVSGPSSTACGCSWAHCGRRLHYEAPPEAQTTVPVALPGRHHRRRSSSARRRDRRRADLDRNRERNAIHLVRPPITTTRALPVSAGSAFLFCRRRRTHMKHGKEFVRIVVFSVFDGQQRL